MHRMQNSTLRLFLNRICLLFILFAGPSVIDADIASFDASSWDHGNGSQIGWNDGEFIGVTQLDDGNETLQIESNTFGTAVPTGDHFSRIDASFFTGFAFQLLPSTTVNTTSFGNYGRFDFTFSFPVQLDSFTLTDVDRFNGRWSDIIAAEGFSTQTPGGVGSGFSPNYAFESTTNLEEVSAFNLSAVRPQPSTSNVLNTPDSHVTFNFTEEIQSFSIYYWNENANDTRAGTQTIGIRGNEFEISQFVPVPEPANGIFAILLAITTVLRRIRSRA